MVSKGLKKGARCSEKNSFLLILVKHCRNGKFISYAIADEVMLELWIPKKEKV